MPIGNLTSQIFANIYLNEFDRFIKHDVRVKKYVRYGDDFVLIGRGADEVREWRCAAQEFLREELHLALHARNDVIVKTRHGIRFLGVEIFPTGRRLLKRNKNRIAGRLSKRNASSYFGMIQHHGSEKKKKAFHWDVLCLENHEKK